MSSDTSSKTGGARRDLYLILGMLIGVVAISTVLYWAATTGRVDLPGMLGTKNNGDLIRPPRAFAEMTLRKSDGTPFDYTREKPRWTLLIPVASHCDESCAQTLYLTRQIRTALGKNLDRVQRYFISKSGAPDAEFEKLLTQHVGAQVLLADAAAFDKLFEGFEPVRDRHYFVVDPDGWLMMAYRPDHGGQAVIADLKFLLGNSHENEVSAQERAAGKGDAH